MFTLVLTIHLILCAILIALVLLQQGKGADMGAAFSGGSNTLFGASGASSVLTRITTTTAVLFMCTSIALVKLYQNVTPTGPSDPLKGSVMDSVAPVQKDAAPVEGAPAAVPPAAQVPAASQPKPVENVVPKAPAESAPAKAAAVPPAKDGKK